MATQYIVSLRDFNNGNPTNGGYATGNAATYITSATMTSSLPAASPTGSYTNSGSSTATTWAQSVIKQANGGPILIFIHGFDNTANDVVQKHAILDYALAALFNANKGSYCLVSFDWPTQGDIPSQVAQVYLQSQSYAIQAGPLLVTTCLQVLVNAGAKTSQLNILTHSMGALVLQNALASANNPPSVNQVLMAEADHFQSAFDVDYKAPKSPSPFPPASATPYQPPWPSGPVVATLLGYCNGLTVYCSGQDQALKDAPLTDGTTRLGYVGLPTDTLNAQSKCNNVDYTSYYEAIYVQNPFAPGSEPASSATHVWPLMSTAQVLNPPAGYPGGTGIAQWQPKTKYSEGAVVVPTPTNPASLYYYTCVTGGKSALLGTNQPTWPTTTGDNVGDNTVTWTCSGPWPVAPDPHFITDVYQVLTGAKTFTERAQGSPSNNWTFTT